MGSESVLVECEDQKALALILRHMNAFNETMLLRCAINLDLPNIIHHLSGEDGGATLSRVAAALPRQPVNIDHLHRILRSLVHIGLLTININSDPASKDSYSLTRGSELFLLGDGEKSLGPYIELMTNPFAISLWNDLGTSPFIDTSVTEANYGTALWDLLSARPELNDTFNKAMVSLARVLVSAVVGGLNLEGASSLVDVGGGTGTAAKRIMEAFPHVRCMVLELPHVVGGPGMAGGVEFVQGNMFERVPHADAVLLMRVLHDWGNQDCVKILKRCKEAMPSKTGKLILVEMVMEEDKDDEQIRSLKLSLDLAMMVFNGGKERSRIEWTCILLEAGFNVGRVTPILLGKYSVIEARPI